MHLQYCPTGLGNDVHLLSSHDTSQLACSFQDIYIGSDWGTIDNDIDVYGTHMTGIIQDDEESVIQASSELPYAPLCQHCSRSALEDNDAHCLVCLHCSVSPQAARHVKTPTTRLLRCCTPCAVNHTSSFVNNFSGLVPLWTIQLVWFLRVPYLLS